MFQQREIISTHPIHSSAGGRLEGLVHNGDSRKYSRYSASYRTTIVEKCNAMSASEKSLLQKNDVGKVPETSSKVASEVEFEELNLVEEQKLLSSQCAV